MATSTRATVKQAVSRKYAAFHAHGCLQCGRRYSDACEVPLVNAVCTSCRTGQPVPFWDQHRFPAECCTIKSKPVTDVVILNSYALAGPGPWFQCRSCGRTHPFDPSQFSPTLGATA